MGQLTNTKDDYEIIRRVRLIEAREAKGLGRSALADQIGVHKAFITRVEEGVRRPSLEIMMRWAKLLDCSLDSFGDDANRSAA